MTTLTLDDGRVLRLRQRKLGGPLSVQVLGEMRPDGFRQVLQEFVIPEQDVRDFVLAQFAKQEI